MPPTRMTSPAQLREAYRQVSDKVAQAAVRSGRRPQDVILIAVTKYAGPDQVRHLVDLGHMDFGESRAQQLQQRVPQIDEFLLRKRTLAGALPRGGEQAASKVRWHMIGHLQRNKVKQVVPLVQLIHSVDSLRLAEELHGYAARLDRTIDVLLQTNSSGEASKGGVAPPAVLALLEQMDTMLHLRVRGLMTMAAYSENPEDARPAFARTAELFHEARSQGLGGDTFNLLSMGMSGDYEVAISEGANLVRVGSALFGDAPDDSDHTDDEPRQAAGDDDDAE